jgi:hypothetical protein
LRDTNGSGILVRSCKTLWRILAKLGPPGDHSQIAALRDEAMAADFSAHALIGLPSAADVLKKMEEIQAGKALDLAREKAAAEAEAQRRVEQLSKPSGVSDEERLRRAIAIIEHGIANGLMEVEVARFPSALCTDHGRAINQVEAGWEETLTGQPKELYEFWKTHLKPLGYRARFQIVTFPDGMPGDVGVTLSWRKRVGQ